MFAWERERERRRGRGRISRIFPCARKPPDRGRWSEKEEKPRQESAAHGRKLINVGQKKGYEAEGEVCSSS